MPRDLLAIYLNDHLAGATVGRAVSSRTASSNASNQTYHSALSELAEEIAEDRESLVAIMTELDIGVDRLKQLAAWGAEKAGRLKLNGRLLSYSPLSRVDELELLALGVTGKLALWRSLTFLSPREPRLDAQRLGTLTARGERQLEAIETCRQAAVIEAIS